MLSLCHHWLCRLRGQHCRDNLPHNCMRQSHGSDESPDKARMQERGVRQQNDPSFLWGAQGVTWGCVSSHGSWADMFRSGSSLSHQICHSRSLTWIRTHLDLFSLLSPRKYKKTDISDGVYTWSLIRVRLESSDTWRQRVGRARKVGDAKPVISYSHSDWSSLVIFPLFALA